MSRINYWCAIIKLALNGYTEKKGEIDCITL